RPAEFPPLPLHDPLPTSAEIFDALTRRTAEAFGLDAEIGTVAVGKRADLLLLDRDPTIDPTAYDAIHTVIVDVRPIRRETLSAKDRKSTRLNSSHVKISY